MDHFSNVLEACEHVETGSAIAIADGLKKLCRGNCLDEGSIVWRPIFF
jgi:hypothetical protein